MTKILMDRELTSDIKYEIIYLESSDNSKWGDGSGR